MTSDPAPGAEPTLSGETLRFADLYVGFPLAPASFPVTSGALESFGAATGGLAPAGELGTVAPPAFAAVYVRACYSSLRSPRGGVHAKQRYRFHQPVRVDDVIVTSGRITELYLKRGNQYVAIETASVNQDGALVTEGWALRIWPRDEVVG